VDLADGMRQCRSRAWYKDQMDVVRHQAIGPNLNAAPGTPFAHQPAIQGIIRVAKEHRLSAIAALRNMVRFTWNNNTGRS